MLLPARIVIFTACLLTAYAVPNIKPRIIAATSLVSNTISTAKAVKACNDELSNQQQQITQQLNDQTIACIAATNATLKGINDQVAGTANLVRGNMTALELNAQNCTNIVDNVDFMQCTLNSHGTDLDLLNNAFGAAAAGMNQAETLEGAAKSEQSSCMNKVMSAAAQNTSQVDDAYETCIQNAFTPNQN